jgi:integrase
MQTGSVTRHGRGWRGYWREDGKRRATATYAKKGEARASLNTELARLTQGAAYIAPITLRVLAERWQARYNAAARTQSLARARLQRPLAAFGDAQAGEVTAEDIERMLADPAIGKAYRRDITRTLRMVYAFGTRTRLVTTNPARDVDAPKPIRGERITPFESWAEVEAVATECGRWGPLVLFMVDTGARPAEAVAVEWRHVDLTVGTVELPGQKTAGAWRTVHLTSRGRDAIAAMPRSLTTRHVFHSDGRPVSWVYVWREVWRPALKAASLQYRAPYNLRHTFAYFSLRAGVPIADVSRDMGHENVATTYQVYGRWCREMGARGAALREAWGAEPPAEGTNTAP